MLVLFPILVIIYCMKVFQKPTAPVPVIMARFLSAIEHQVAL